MIRTLPTALALAALTLSGVAVAGPPRLAALYEVSALLQGSPSSYLWRPAEGMLDSCGPAKAPVGLGRFEAESVAHAASPTLAILLRQDPGDPPLGPAALRVSVGSGEDRVILQPMVEPRPLSILLHGQGDPAGLVRATQLVATQLRMELCLEHKVGRAWLGGDSRGLRQAFLLDPAEGGRADRRAFGGQRDPVPALIGPPDACFDPASGLPVADAVGGRGEGTLDLVPSDVWGASLRTCEADERAGATWLGRPAPLRFRLSGEGDGPPASAVARWLGLEVEIQAGVEDPSTRVSARLDGVEVLAEQPLFPDGARGGLTDVLAALPYTYPQVGPFDDPGRYTLLLVPGWQLNEAARRLEAGTPALSRPTAGPELQDGVGWILAHPEQLWVQVPGEAADGPWLDLMDPARPGPLGSRAWGYAVGSLMAREPVALPADDPPSVDLALVAQRATPQALFLLALGVGGVGVLAGLRRLPELWLPQAEERADYWPGDAVPEEEDEPEAAEPDVVGGA